MNSESSNSREFVFDCRLRNGLHARPASHLADVANRYRAESQLTNLRNGLEGDLKSVLAMIAVDVRASDRCRVRVEGEDGEAACSELRRFIEQELPGCDEPLAQVAIKGNADSLPRGLRSAGLQCHFGIPVSRGVGRGKAVILGSLALAAGQAAESPDSPEEERNRLHRALTQVRDRVQSSLVQNADITQRAILQAHAAILGDAGLRRELEERIALGRSAAGAVVDAGNHFAGLLNQSGSAYIRERTVDVREICAQLLEEVAEPGSQPAPIELDGPAVVVADILGPQQLLGFDRRWLKGIVLGSAGSTSHAMILARSLGIPAVAGLADATRLFAPGEEILVDANRGLVIPRCTAEALRFYDREQQAYRRREAVLSKFSMAPAVTADGRMLEIGANVSSAVDARHAFANGADGIGLFRTEFLFLHRSTPPSEDEQLAVYETAVGAAGGRPVILRTVDVGGDKPLPYLELPLERNPFLGCRGVRMYAGHEEMLRTQLRAVLRASVAGIVKVMAPMVSSLDEALWFKHQVALAKSELLARGSGFDTAIPIGAMIEVPSAAFILGALSAELDFFSIGTNDLSQYFFAVDRENAGLAELSDVRHPGFLALLKQIADELGMLGKWVGMCGEMAGEARNLPLLVGLGLNEISAVASEIPALKEKAAHLSAAGCRKLLAEAVRCGTATEVDRLLSGSAEVQAPRPLLDAGLVTLNSASRDKDEAIREMVDALYAAGRTEDPQGLEDAIWAREAVYATGLGFGLAVPHCKSDAVSANSIGVLKLKHAVEWGSLDGKPVSMVILLAMRDAGPDGFHMQVFSRLARMLMDESFRARLMSIADPHELVSQIGEELNAAVAPADGGQANGATQPQGSGVHWNRRDQVGQNTGLTRRLT